MRWDDFFTKPAYIYITSIIAGLLFPLAFAPFGWFPLAYLSVILLFIIWPKLTPKQAFKSAWLFGLAAFGLGVSWIFVAINEFGNTPAAAAAVLVLIFVAFVSFVFALQAPLWTKYCAHSRFIIFKLLSFASMWVLFEWLRGWVLNGFPWLNLGTSQIDSLFANWAPIFGVYGVSWMSIVAVLLLYLAVITRPFSKVMGLSAIIIWGVSFVPATMHWTQAIDAPIKVSLIQGNAPQLTKWDARKIKIRLDTYAQLTRENYASDLIIWPENSLTNFYHRLADVYLDPLVKEARENNTDLIVGVPYMDLETKKYYSSLMSFSDKPGVYFKSHLVPFGEFIPLESLLRGLVGFFDLPMSSFSAGELDQPLLYAAGQPLAASICFEDAFGAELIRQLPEATLLVNGSNNAWYGDSFAPHQHLQISRMRALETGRMMMRATTNGISAFIDHRGNIKSHTTQFASTVLTDTVQPRSGATPYVRWGNYPIIIFSTLILLIAGFASRKTA